MKRIQALLIAAAVIGGVLTWHGVRQGREFRRLIELGDTSLAAGQTSVAIEAFSGAVALDPDSMLGYLKRGDTYRRRGELSAAARDLRQAEGLDPAATRPVETLGDVHVSMGRFDRAIQDYRRFISLDDRSQQVLYKLALAYYRNGQASEAIDTLRQALAIHDRFAEAHYLLGVCLRELRRDAEAVGALRKAIQLNATFPPARAELADLYMAVGRSREGIEQLEALAAIEPARAERLVSVSLAFARLGRTDAAVVTLGRAAERDPGASVVYAALGRVWLEAAEARDDRVALDKALEALRPIASRENASGESLGLYGRALFGAGDSAAAERVLLQAASKVPVDPATFLYLAAAAQRLSHADTARGAIADYVALAGGDPADATQQVAGLFALQRRLRISAAGSSPDRARPGDRRPRN